MFGRILKESNGIKKVIFGGPCYVSFWEDGEGVGDFREDFFFFFLIFSFRSFAFWGFD